MAVETTPSLFQSMSALADPVRGRLLRVLERHELTVSELCAVFQLPQSTMSRHLRALSDEGWLVARAEGTSRRYRMLPEQLDAAARGLWRLVGEQVGRMPAAAQDAQRVRSVLALRRSRSQEFFSTSAGEWDRVRGELYGRRADLLALPGLLDPAWTVGDLGCGTGEATEALAPFVARVVAVDESPEMLAAARRRLAERPEVELRRGSLESLPLGDGELDAAVVSLVLHYVVDPEVALREVARALRPGGRLLLVDMTPHDREEYRQTMGHVWPGFAADRLAAWFDAAGLEGFRYVPLPADPEAKGPGLFAATGSRRNYEL